MTNQIKYKWATLGTGVIANELAQALEALGGKLYSVANRTYDKGVAFGISNVTHYRGRENQTFIEWSRRYKMHEIKSNYISYHDNTQKQSREVFVTNY